MTADPCVFCDIVERRAPATILEETDSSMVLVPLGPVTNGHVLVIPKRHLRDAADNPLAATDVFLQASRWARRKGTPFNLITSAGREATQSVFHLHVHYVPRAADDELMVPWGTAWGENPQDPHWCRVARRERMIAGELAEQADVYLAPSVRIGRDEQYRAAARLVDDGHANERDIPTP